MYCDQIGKVVNSSHENNFNTIVSSVKCPTNLVDIAVTPRETYEDPLAPFFDDSRVERRIDKMLDCDALVDEEEGLNNYDIKKIEQF